MYGVINSLMAWKKASVARVREDFGSPAVFVGGGVGELFSPAEDGLSSTGSEISEGFLVSSNDDEGVSLYA